MALLADNLWFTRNQHHYRSNHHSAVAAVLQDEEELEEAVPAINVQPKWSQPPANPSSRPASK